MENQTVNNNDEVEIDLGEVFHLLLSKLGVIILSGIVFCLAAVMGTAASVAMATSVTFTRDVAVRLNPQPRSWYCPSRTAAH